MNEAPGLPVDDVMERLETKYSGTSGISDAT